MMISDTLYQCLVAEGLGSSIYPRITLRLRPPIEIENLLPYDIRYRIFDKNRERNWTSFLRKGGTSPIHVAELSHLILLSVELQDTRKYFSMGDGIMFKFLTLFPLAFKRSEFAIINTDNPGTSPPEKWHKMIRLTDGLKEDLPVEDILPLQDKEGLELRLRINYLFVFVFCSYPLFANSFA
jgi:vacuolar protein sorting-associated protein 13A/C